MKAEKRSKTGYITIFYCDARMIIFIYRELKFFWQCGVTIWFALDYSTTQQNNVILQNHNSNKRKR